MRKIDRPDLRSPHNDAHNGDPNFLPRDVDDNDLIKTGLAHPLDDEFDVIGHGWMLIRRDIVEADGRASTVPRRYRRCSLGWNEVRQILPAALYAGQRDCAASVNARVRAIRASG